MQSEFRRATVDPLLRTQRQEGVLFRQQLSPFNPDNPQMMNRSFMKHTTVIFRRLLLVLAAGCLLGADLRAAITFTVTPSTVSNTYSGVVTLDIAGLSAGQTVTVQKFIDGNTNGAIDGTDWLAQQFALTDGQISVIGGMTNLNIPGDIASASGTIRAQLNVQMGGISQRLVGGFAFRLSSPSGQFAPLTNLFTITNSAFAQSLNGNVTCSGTNVPNASLLIFPGSMGNSSPTAGVVANNSGGYTLKAVPGNYGLLPFKPGLVSDLATSPTVALNPGVTLNTNLNLLPATRTISGRFVDATNTNLGLPGILVVCESMDNRLAIGFTDTNGNFTVPVTPGLWRVSLDSESLPTGGYLDIQNRPSVDTTTGNVTGVIAAYPKGTALIYGSIKDDLNRALPGVSLWASDNLNQFSGTGVTDPSGNYVAAVMAGSWYISPDNSSPVLANYVVTQGAQVALTGGQAVRQDFRAIPATNHISGYVTNSSNNGPVSGVGVYCHANISGTDYNQYTTTDPNGYYSLNVANGTWGVGLSCGGGSESLDTLGFQCVPEQSRTIANNNGVINFAVQPCSPLQVTTSSPLPNGQVNIYYGLTFEASGCFQPFNWSLAPASGPLPPGMGLSSNGSFQGNPGASGTFSFTVRVSDNNGGWADQTLSLTITPAQSPLQILTTSLPNGTNGFFYSQQCFASGGQQPYSWSLMPGSADLPPGLAISAGGIISGTPTTSGTAYFYVRVTDAALATSDQFLSLNLYNPPLQLTNTSLPNATVSGLYSTQLGATGGQPPYSWELALGSANLPAGLSLSSSGLISGTPSVSGQFNFIVKVTDTNLASVNRPLGIKVNPRPTLGLASKPSATQFQFQINGVAGQNYTIQASTNLSGWQSLWTTNAPSASFTVLVPGATNACTFYRVLVAP